MITFATVGQTLTIRTFSSKNPTAIQSIVPATVAGYAIQEPTAAEPIVRLRLLVIQRTITEVKDKPSIVNDVYYVVEPTLDANGFWAWHAVYKFTNAEADTTPYHFSPTLNAISRVAFPPAPVPAKH